MTLEDFLKKLRETEISDALMDFCRKYVLHGTPYVFNGREDAFYDFRNRIAREFDVSFHEIYITGSAKLGFSPYKKTQFSYDSDIDVAIVSDLLFERIMEIVREYQMNLRAARRTLSVREINTYHEFLEYTAIGWIRPDKLPLSFRISDFKGDWFEFFDSISNGKSEVGNYKVSAGVFRTYRHLELYTTSGLRRLQKTLALEK